MSSIGLFYGTTTGNTEAAAGHIKAAFDEFEREIVQVFDVGGDHAKAMGDFDYLILGIPTWSIGELQSDWEDIWDELDEVNLIAKRVAIFGLGDQYSYPDTFQDAMGILGEKVRECGAQLVGSWSIVGYEFDESRGVENGKFMGLSLDDDNQSELTGERIKAWVKQLAEEFELA